MKRLCLSITLAVVAVVSIVMPVLAAYYADIDVTESNGTSYVNQPIVASVGIEDMADNHFCLLNATDLRVLDDNDNELPFTPADDYLAFVGNITGSTTNSFQLTTGNTPLSTFPIVTGESGYVTIFDDADLELGNNFSIELSGYFDTSANNPTPCYPGPSGTNTSKVEGSAGTSHTVDFPTGVSAGDLLIIVFQTGHTSNNHTIYPNAGWTIPVHVGQNTTSNLQIMYKVATGAEGAGLTIGTTAACFSAHEAFRILAGTYTGTPEWQVGAATFTANPNPPGLSPSWGAYPVLSVTGFGGGGNSSVTVSDYPDDYGNDEYVEADGSTYFTHVATATRLVSMSTEDAGAFTLSGSTTSRAFTIALRGVVPTTYYVAKQNAFYIYPDNGTINALYFGSLLYPVSPASANVSSGNHTVNVWATGSYFGLDVDGVTEDENVQYTTEVPDLATWWRIHNMAWFDYYEQDTGELVEGGSEETLYEYCNTGDDTDIDAECEWWFAQTFTPDTTHNLTTIKLKLWQAGNPGIADFYIRAVDGSHKPTGGNLATGTYNSSLITTSSPGQWYTINMTSPYTVSSGTEYSILISVPDATCVGPASSVSWRMINAGNYSGYSWMSSNYGSTWYDIGDNDFMFEEYGVTTTYNMSWTPILRYEPTSFIEGNVLPNEEDPGTYDGLIMFGTNPAGVSVDVDTLQSDQTYYYYTETDTTSPDVIEPEPPVMTSDVDLDKLEKNPLNPLVESFVADSGGLLTARFIWLGIGWVVFIAVFGYVLIKSHGHIVLTCSVGLGLAAFSYVLGIFNYAILILLCIGFIAAIVGEKVKQW